MTSIQYTSEKSPLWRPSSIHQKIVHYEVFFQNIYLNTPQPAFSKKEVRHGMILIIKSVSVNLKLNLSSEKEHRSLILRNWPHVPLIVSLERGKPPPCLVLASSKLHIVCTCVLVHFCTCPLPNYISCVSAEHQVVVNTGTHYRL